MAAVPPTVVDRGSRPERLLLRLLGWRVRSNGTPAGCGVIIAFPHTSNWDFVISILTQRAIGIPIAFLAKESLFRMPLLGALMRWCGGIPVQRGSASGLIDDMSRRMRAAEGNGTRWWLALTPEGTRKAGDGWHAGFYHIAVAADAPIGLGYFNYARKEVGLTAFLRPSGDADADMQQIGRWYAEHAVGRHPDSASPVRFKSPR